MITVKCYGHGPGEWLREDPAYAEIHEISEEDAARFISEVTKGGYGDSSMCVLAVLPNLDDEQPPIDEHPPL